MFDVVTYFTSWLPPLVGSIFDCAFALFEFYVICKVIKLLWDVLPVL